MRPNLKWRQKLFCSSSVNGRQVDWFYAVGEDILAQADERWDDVQIVCVVLIRFAVWDDTGSLDGAVVVLYDDVVGLKMERVGW